MAVPKFRQKESRTRPSLSSFAIAAGRSHRKGSAVVADNSSRLHTTVSFGDGIGASAGIRTCGACPMHSLSLCVDAANPIRKSDSIGSVDLTIRCTVHRAPARKLVCHPKEWSDSATVICEGIALSSISTNNGNRQILSVLLPGDIVSPSSLFTTRIGYTTEAITVVTYRKFSRQKMQEYLSAYPAVLEEIIEVISNESLRTHKLLLDLGCRSGEERIASFILDFYSRMKSVGCADEFTMSFPFRLHHLAEALGLSAVYTSKVLSKLEDSGLIKLKLRVLQIQSIKQLREVAGTD